MKKRGFTLIELLAVILILGIIALIAIPTVSKITKEAKKGAFGTTTQNVAGAIEDACLQETLTNMPITTKYTFSGGVVSPALDVKGKLPTNGTALVDNDCNVTISVSNGTFVATKPSTKDIVSVAEGSEAPAINPTYVDGTAIYFNPVSGTKCTAGEAVSTTGTKTGCMKWYAFNDSGSSSDTVNLILDHNTTAAVLWNSNTTDGNIYGPSEVITQLQTDTSSWAGVPTRTDSYSLSNGTANYTINYSTYKARLITAAEIATITKNTTFNETSSDWSTWYYLDSNNHTFTKTTPGSSDYDWLFDYTKGCTNYGCNIDDDAIAGYWTSTAIFDDAFSVWGVSHYGNLDFDFYAVFFNGEVGGVRPVITIPKSNL